MPVRDYFGVFGLEPKLSLDPADLQTRFYSLSREWHPDKFARSSSAEQERALEMTSLLNDGLRTLKDPVRRAEYILSQHGFEVAEQRGKDVPPELLEEVFELNLALEELSSGDESAKAQIQDALANFCAMRTEMDAEIGQIFHEYDRAPSKEVLGRLRAVLNRRRYIDNLVNEANKATEQG